MFLVLSFNIFAVLLAVGFGLKRLNSGLLNYSNNFWGF